MFSVKQKREIADKVERILRETQHPELPDGNITFTLTVEGAESWSWAVIRNNSAVLVPDANPHNERMDNQKQLLTPDVFTGVLHILR
jgi:hypothetical protein